MLGEVLSIIFPCGEFCGIAVRTDDGSVDGSILCAGDNVYSAEGLIDDAAAGKLDGAMEGVN